MQRYHQKMDIHRDGLSPTLRRKRLGLEPALTRLRFLLSFLCTPCPWAIAPSIIDTAATAITAIPVLDSDDGDAKLHHQLIHS